MCDGYLFERISNVDFSKAKLISDYTDEELETYIWSRI